MAAPASQTDLTTERLSALTLPQGGWSTQAREDALARVRAMGLPGRRDEYWKFTAPDRLTAPAVKAAVFTHDEAPVFSEIDRLKIVFGNGIAFWSHWIRY